MHQLLHFSGAAATGELEAKSGHAARGSRPGGQNGATMRLPDVEGYIRGEMERLRIPGLAVGIVRGDQAVYMQGFGRADSQGNPITPGSLFHAGSIMKSFTALAAMQLAEDGRLELDAPIQHYLDWFRLADRRESSRIAVKHLINHSSGISTLDGNRFWKGSHGMEEAARRLAWVRPRHAPGARFQYSNANYVLLGLLIEEVTGNSFSDYIDCRVLGPLQMQHSFVCHECAIYEGLSQGHYYVLDRPVQRDGTFPEVYEPAGGLATSVDDMTHYLIAQLNEGRYRDASVLSPQGMAALQAPSIPMNEHNHYAMGWVTGTLDGMRALWHSGDITNFHAMTLLQPENGWGVVLLANATGFEQMGLADDICRNLVRLLNGRRLHRVGAALRLRLLYRGILLAPFLLAIGIAWAMVGGQNGRALTPWQAGLMTAIYLGVAVLCLFKIRGLVPFPLSSMRIYYPEFAWSLIASAGLGIGWGIALPMLRWMA